MIYIGYTILTIYTIALIYITIYCLMQFHLLVQYHRFHWQEKRGTPTKIPILNGNLPFVTIQLPIYNEKFVVQRLIDNICLMDYPKDKMEIHILDDSDDETRDIVEQKVKEYQEEGFNIKSIRRAIRQGYKAGALRDGMAYSKGAFIAIFDADFLPKKNFLRSTLAYFNNPEIGVVQTRWEHINQNYSLLTRLQAFQLNVHFTVEQMGREAGEYLLQFNGTAGVWRRVTIDDAGGWEADTLTEDLDLSYRAQLNGWKIAYLENVVSPSELPAEMSGLKSQQFRWMKGGAETARKMLPTVWKSDINFGKKIHASAHLLSSTVFLGVFIIGVFSVPLLFFLQILPIDHSFFICFLVGLLAIMMVYFRGNMSTFWGGDTLFQKLLKFIFLFPIFLAISMGLSFHNSIAVLQGYLGKKTSFIRTPKFNIKSAGDMINPAGYTSKRLPYSTIFEGILAIYFLCGLAFGIYIEVNTFIAFHFLLFIGYGCIFYWSLRHLRLHS